MDIVGTVVPWFVKGYSENKAEMRRGYGIHFYAGNNGGGKSFAMIHDTIPSLENGRRVLSTVRLLDYRRPRPCPGGAYCDDLVGHERERVVYDLRLVNRLDPLDEQPDPQDPNTVELVTEVPTGIIDVHAAAHPLYVPLRSYEQVVDWRSGDLLLDEVQGVASSRESMRMPAQLASKLHQLRRDDVLLRLSGVRFARADKVIREAVQAVTDCRGRHEVYRVSTDGSRRVWRDRRMFEWATYDDVAGFDEWSQGKADAADPVVYQRLWRPGCQVERAYDTLDQVLALGAADGTGSGDCISCGGRRKPKPCTCPDQRPAAGLDQHGAVRGPREGAPASVRGARARAGRTAAAAIGT